MIIRLVWFLHVALLALHWMHFDVILNVFVDVRSLSYAQGPKDLQPGVWQPLSEYYQDHANSENEGNDPGVADSA